MSAPGPDADVPPVPLVAYPIVTRRLVLRPVAPSDVDDVWAYQRHPEVARFMPWEARERHESATAVAGMVVEDQLVEEGDCLCLAVVWPQVDRMVGHVELVWCSQEHRQGEIGFAFNPEFHGRGLATEAATAILRLGFEHFGLHRIVGRCNARNRPSARLMERLGMRLEGHLRGNMLFKGEWKEELVYAMTAPEWRARQQLTSRLATHADLPVLLALIDAAIGELQRGFLDEAQIASSRTIMGVDTQLIDDGTYYVVESAGRIVGCGGWSRRATLYGGDHSPGRDPARLDPATDPAKVRAMYTHPEATRRGVGRLILARCEAAAAAEGFTTLELMATLSGRPLYEAAGFVPVEHVEDATGGTPVPLIRMRKPIVPA
ncbi:GNAT family N-acetyltransferase [Micromonospora zhanjiangensis]|uniref:GNAT family N-acetyltransferase n=1 Tax=Micromonospora zhanjiangensis TaxID=1522057 RepID=A0ABV8KLY0_9ACTN